jgi:DNA-binding NtrC family response regulator
MPRVLVVDDEAGVRESMRMLLHDDYTVSLASGVDEALAVLAIETPDLVILDLVMPGRSGLELLEELRERNGMPPVVVLSATRAIDSAVAAMKLGAADFLTKPFDVDALRLKLRQLLKHRALEEEVVRLRDAIAQRDEGSGGHRRDRLGGLLGASQAMREVFRLIERAAESRAPVLLSGESGTGKELAARAIHDLGGRRAGPFVAINCAAIPETLLESELFGHERGAFTDARERRVGKFEAASGGSLFLDEIGELAPAMQAKLLRALQEQSVDRVGASESIPVDVRVIAATNRDLHRAVEEGRFRSDLFYRVHVLPIALPPLRERRGDIPLLTEAFLARAAEGRGGEPIRLGDDARQALAGYSWPGNVRELENALERAVALGEGGVITAADLPEEIRHGAETEGLAEAVRNGALDLEAAVARFETRLIREVLVRTGRNQTRAAKQLGITRRLLKLKMDRYAL